MRRRRYHCRGFEARTNHVHCYEDQSSKHDCTTLQVDPTQRLTREEQETRPPSLLFSTRLMHKQISPPVVKQRFLV